MNEGEKKEVKSLLKFSTNKMSGVSQNDGVRGRILALLWSLLSSLHDTIVCDQCTIRVVDSVACRQIAQELDRVFDSVRRVLDKSCSNVLCDQPTVPRSVLSSTRLLPPTSTERAIIPLGFWKGIAYLTSLWARVA